MLKTLKTTILLLATALSANADTIDFKSKPEIKYYGHGAKTSYKEVKNVNGNVRQLPTLTWQTKHDKWAGFGLKQPVASRLLATPLNATISFPVLCSSPQNIKSIHLWMKDLESKEIKWKSRASLKQGWNDIIFRIDNKNYSVIKEGKKHKVAPPLRFFGVGIVFKNKDVKAGQMVFGNITIKGDDHDKLPVSKQIWKFDDSEKWFIKKGFEVYVEANGLKVVADKNTNPKKANIGRLKEIFFDLKDCGSPEEIALNVDLIKGGKATISLMMQDAHGESFALKQQPIKDGANSITWNTFNDVAGSWGKNKDSIMNFPAYLKAIAIHQYKSETPVELLFKSGFIKESLSQLQALDVNISTGTPVYLLKEGEEDKLSVNIKNRYPKESSFSIDMSFKNFKGKTIEYNRSFKLSSKEEISWNIPWDKTHSRGIWWVDYNIKNGKDSIRHGRFSFTYNKPAGPNSINNEDFQLGMCIRQHRWAMQDQVTEAIACAYAGVKLLRTGYTWGSIEREQGNYNFGPMDKLIALNEKYNMSLLPIIGYTPKWAATEERQNSKDWNDWSKSAPNQDALRKFVKVFSERYNDKIKYWEFWNEPDINFWRGTLEDYIACLKVVYEELKQTDPENKLICGGFAFADSYIPEKKGFHKAAVKDGQEWFDFHGYHQHGDFTPFEKTLENEIKDIRSTLKSPKPLFFTETGFYTSGDNEDQQANNVVKKIVYGWSLGAKGYIWFDMRNDGFDSGYMEHNYGLMTNDFYPKAGYTAFLTLANELGKAKYESRINLTPGNRGYLFRDGNDKVVVLWNDNNDKAREVITMNTDAAEAQVIDIMGNKKNIPVIQGKIAVTLEEFPVYVRLKGTSSTPKPSTPLIAFPSDFSLVIPGKSFTFTSAITNPYNSPVNVKLQWELPEGFTTETKEQSLELEANAAATAVYEINVSSDYKSRIADLKLHYQILPDNISGTCAVPVNLAVAIPRGNFSKSSQFNINRKEDVVDQMAHNPFTSHRMWKGAQDQSAEVRLAYKDGSISARIDVTDDIHNQTNSAMKSYIGDGIQLAIHVPGQSSHWEIGLARLEDGSSGVYTWIKPEEFNDPTGKIALKTSREGNVTTYEASIPLEALQIDTMTLENGIRFNMIINENDGEGRDGWIQIAPGIGESKNIEKYPFIVLKK